MADELNQRRNFIKRNAGNGVVTGRAKKKEILYKKTMAWNEFYDAAK